jgi:hypothetical protein
MVSLFVFFYSRSILSIRFQLLKAVFWKMLLRPLEVIGHDGKAYNVTMEPGDLVSSVLFSNFSFSTYLLHTLQTILFLVSKVLYESHSVLHGVSPTRFLPLD